ncbi:Crp/Fnr family transcriptional regulator [Paenibacillus hodogayensis]|uniref:Crp/Fnr family transcriptional regulator n=1 Tax=Paenibacillus hodogayensis TaxID=279208 RepID=A0ABV5VWJ8_9BACL
MDKSTSNALTDDAKALTAMRMQIDRIVPIPPEEWAFFAARTSRRTLLQHDHFVRAGEELDEIAFCTCGLFRLYYTTPDGAEFNKNFCTSGDFVTVYSSLLQQVPSYFSIQAMADSELIVFRYSDFKPLYDRHACWERLGRVIAEMLYLHKETRERELLLYSAEERYRLFLQRYASLSRQLPLYHVASYLGITPVALSRIRKKMTDLNLG